MWSMAWPSLGSDSPRCTRIHTSLKPGALYLMPSMRPFSLVRSPPNFACSQPKTSSGSGRAQMDVVQAEQFRILHNFDARAPWIFDKRQLEKPGHVAHRRDDFDAGSLEFLHLRVKIRRTRSRGDRWRCHCSASRPLSA